MPNKRQRPVYLDLTRIHQPVIAILSIAHRLSGLALVLLIPALIFFFDRSLAGDRGFEEVAGTLRTPAARLALVLLAWVFAHHFFAGIRHLLLDAEIGIELRHARASAWAVFGAGVIVMLAVAVALLA
jgi:succinate dehydrogenase / fumarate reductase cytochrome b subunit